MLEYVLMYVCFKERAQEESGCDGEEGQGPLELSLLRLMEHLSSCSTLETFDENHLPAKVT